MKKKKIENNLFSFLDIISCGFGAVVILVLILKYNPSKENIEQSEDLYNLTVELKKLERTQKELENSTSLLRQKLSKVEKNLISELNELSIIENKLENKNQLNRSLSESLQILELVKNKAQSFKPSSIEQTNRDLEVGGIPTDSNYIIFVVDTSGSMLRIWDKVSRKMENILNIHPNVKGFQILNDMGIPLISGYKNRWIPDTKTWRKNSLKLFKSWSSASTSSPIEGILTALNDYSSSDKSISIYAIGDDYTGNTYDQHINNITSVNRKKKFKTRIHGIGFLAKDTTDRFSILMRELTYRNNGTFLALPK